VDRLIKSKRLIGTAEPVPLRIVGDSFRHRNPEHVVRQPQMLLKKSQKQIPRQLKSPRDDKEYKEA
jgi:hypothetical protein